MKRNAIQDMINWRNSTERKPLILKGARRTGKTWLIKEFGKNFYSNLVYINFEEYADMKSIFEEANEYHVIAAGSLLGTILKNPKSYPVGMVSFLSIAPMSYGEFLAAAKPALYASYESIQKDQKIDVICHYRMLEAYNSYLVTGSMPECVASWTQYKDLARVSQIQREIIKSYENDFSKHTDKVTGKRIQMVFRSVVGQLKKSNEKFMYGTVHKGVRASDFEEAIEWLVSTGILNRVCNVSKVEYPLPEFDKPEQFKLFVSDTGLLNCTAGVDNKAILSKSDYRYKEQLTENYILQQLKGRLEVEPRYYSDRYNNGIDFVLQNGTEIIPVEIKGGMFNSSPMFRRYIAEHHPKFALRFSERDYRWDREITEIPLYLAGKIKEMI